MQGRTRSRSWTCMRSTRVHQHRSRLKALHPLEPQDSHHLGTQSNHPLVGNHPLDHPIGSGQEATPGRGTR